MVNNINLLLKQEVVDLLKAGWEFQYEDMYRIQQLYIAEDDRYFALSVLGDPQGIYLPTLEGLEGIIEDIENFKINNQEE